MRIVPVVATLCVLLGACASQSGSDPAPQPQAVSNPAPAPVAASTSASDDASPSRALDDKVEELARQYKVVELDGETKYCKKHKPLGTRIAETICLTRDDLYRMAQQEIELREGYRKPKVCGANCGGGG
jgi:hypothetical protein